MNITNSGARASENNDGLGTSRNDGGSGEEHVDTVLKNCLIILDHSIVFLADTLTLTRQDGLVDGEAVALDCDESAVGRDAIAYGNSDNIARDELISLDSGDMSIVPDDAGLIGRVFLQSSNGLLGTALLRDTNYRIENENGKDLLLDDKSMGCSSID